MFLLSILDQLPKCLIMVWQITGRPPGPEIKNCVDRESYSLAAGLALGLVVLGSGGGPDLTSIPDTLHYYMVGGHVRPFTGSQKDKYKSPR